METYRIFCLEKGRVIEDSFFEAKTDSQALALFSQRNENTDCELWCGDRKVATVPRGTKPFLLDALRNSLAAPAVTQRRP